MGNVLKAFLSKPTTKVGIVTALMFQVIFALIWMTGYSGVSDPERLKQLNVGIVALDTTMGPQIAEQLKQSLPVTTQSIATEEEAARMLNERELQMVVTIPADFSKSASSQDGKAAIHYYINESNPQMIKSVMNSMAAQITSTVNKVAVTQGVQAVLTGAKFPAEQAAGAASALSERVTSNIQYSNVVDGMNNQMVPMMLVLASYVGSMLLGMNLQQSSMMLAGSFGRWQRFAARCIINVAAAVIVSLVGSSLVLALGGQSSHGFLAMWGFQALFVLTFMFLAQLFLLLFGMGGMLFNIIMLSIQLVSSGAMMPRELLPDFYHAISVAFPATYAVEGLMDLLFGGPGAGGAVLGLILIAAAAALLGAGAVALRKGPAPQVAPAKAA